MILVIDVGNTNMVLGLYENEQLTYHWRLASNRAQTADEYGMQVLALFRHVDIDVRDISGIIISSVVPPLMFVLEQLCNKYLHHQPMVVNSNLQTGLDLQIDENKLIYRGELTWSQVVNKMIKLGFEEDPEFNKMCGSNSYKSNTETKEDIKNHQTTF